jgi:hypothetical protein
MSPEIYKKSKNVFLIFPPGCGGNHLANLLSFHPDFEPRYQSDRYLEEIIESYKIKFNTKKVFGKYKGDCAVHFSDLENLQPDHFVKHIETINQLEKKYLFCAHAYEYFNAIKNLPGFKELKDKIFILFTRPTRQNMIAYLRWSEGPWALGEPNLNSKNIQKNNDHLYALESFSKLGIDKDNILLLNTDEFFSDNGIKYCNQLFKENFNINLTSHAPELHQIYIKEKVHIYGSIMP